jgi:hypothetical protein
MQHVDLSSLDEYYGVDIVRPVIEQNTAKEIVPDGGDVDPSQLSVWRLQELPPVRLTLARRGQALARHRPTGSRSSLDE